MGSGKVTVDLIIEMKAEGKKICALTAYDCPTAMYLDQAGIDLILVGDSLGMVVLGYENTLQVTMEDMLHHCSAVARGTERALTVGDMPFLSYATPQQGLENAGRFLQEAGMEAVKLEGGREMYDTVKRIVTAGIPVLGHIGYTPQHSLQFGTKVVQGREKEAAQKLVNDAKALEDAGAFAVVLECMPKKLSAEISSTIKIPTIGIGSGPGCDGQILVTNDLLGLYDRMKPKFVKKYADMANQMKLSFSAYIDEVRAGKFPTDRHSFS